MQGYPTLIKFPPGKKTAASAKHYEGERSADKIVAAAQEMVVAAGGVPAPAVQLVSTTLWSELCASSTKRICILAFLPHILDDQASTGACSSYQMSHTRAFLHVASP